MINLITRSSNRILRILSLGVFSLFLMPDRSLDRSNATTLPGNLAGETRSNPAPDPPLSGWTAQNWPSGNRNQERFLGPSPVPTPIPPRGEEPPPSPSVPEEKPSPSPSETDGEKFSVTGIEITGNTIFQKEIDNFKRPLAEKIVRGEPITEKEARDLVDRITQLYLEKGFLTSGASLIGGSLAAGVVKILVIEGTLEKIEIQTQGFHRLNPDYIRSRVALGSGTPLNVNRLEEQLRLLRANPLFENLAPTLKAGTRPDSSILEIRVNEANPFKGQVSLDNYSSPQTGATRLSLDLAYLDLTGRGDSLIASYRPRLEAFTETYRLEFIYQVPLNPMDGSLQVRALYEPSKVIQEPFNALDITDESQWYSVSFRQPIVRSLSQELALSIGFSYQQGQTFTFRGPTPFGYGPNEQGITRTSTINFAQDYTLRDYSGAWAFRSQLNFGTGLFDATDNPSPIPDGYFFSWLAQAQRVHILNPDNLLIVQLDLQLTPNPLLSSQQFVIGGGQSVRGYQQNARAGDNGVRFSIEDRVIVARGGTGKEVLTVAPFLDLGYVWNVSDNPNPQPPQRFLIGLGAGLIWQPVEGLILRVDYAPPLIYLKHRGNNIQDNGLYFSAGYRF